MVGGLAQLAGTAGRGRVQLGRTAQDLLSATDRSRQDWKMKESKLPFSQFNAWVVTLIALIGVSG